MAFPPASYQIIKNTNSHSKGHDAMGPKLRWVYKKKAAAKTLVVTR